MGSHTPPALHSTVTELSGEGNQSIMCTYDCIPERLVIMVAYEKSTLTASVPGSVTDLFSDFGQVT